MAISHKSVLKTLLFINLLLFCVSGYASENTVRVGIVDPIAPFVITANHHYSGISIDIWQRIATNEHLKYHYVLLNMNTYQAIDLLQHGGIDVLIGPISVTSDRYNKIDFSYPYFLNSIGIIEHTGLSDTGKFISILGDVFESPFFIILVICFILYVHALWIVEKGRNDNFHHRYAPAISHILWTHLLQKGFRQMPATLCGRMISLIWTLVAATFVTSVVAIVTSRLTIALVTKPEHFKQIDDLQDKPLAAVKGTHAYSEAEKVGGDLRAAENLQQAVYWLDKKQVVAVAEDFMIAKNYLKTHDYPKLHMSSVNISNDQYAIALQKNSALLPRINHQILLMQNDDSTVELCARYIGSDAKSCKL
jgi:polar amino acid transport system substrate-binding protein